MPPDLEAALARFLDVVRPKAPGLNWSPVANLHITTKFIGEWPEERIEELKSALAAMAKPSAFRVPIRGVGWFPDPERPRALFAAMDAPEALHELAAGTQQALAALGLEPEARPYKPHITLARIKDQTLDLDPLRRSIGDYPAQDFGVIEAQSFFLYLSRPQARGSVYTKLAEFPLS